MSIGLFCQQTNDTNLILTKLEQVGSVYDWRLVKTESDYLAQLSAQVDLILFEYGLAAFDVTRALQILQECDLDIPFIVIADTYDEQAFLSCIRQGATDCVLKERLARLEMVVERALKNKRLHQEKERAETALREREEWLQRVFDISLEINAQPDLSTLLEAIIQKAAELVDAPMGGLYLTRPDGESLELMFSYNLPGDFQGAVLRWGEGLSGRVAQTGELLMVQDYHRWEGRAHIYDQLSFSRVLGVPLKVGNKTIGVLDVFDDRETGAFGQDQVRLVNFFADQAAIAIERARLLEVEAQRRREAETLQAATHALSATLDLPQVFEVILSELQRVVPYDSATVQQIRGDYSEIIGGRGFGNLDQLLGIRFDLTSNDNPNRQVFQTCAPVILADAPGVYKEFAHKPHAQARIRSWLGVPLLFRDQTIGMIALDKQEPDFYTEEHACLALTFAAQAAIAIENARLFAETSESLTREQRLNQVAQAISGALDLETVLSNIVRLAAELVGANAGSLGLVSDDGAWMTFPHVFNLPEELDREPLPRGKGLAWHIVKTGKPLLLSHYNTHDKALQHWLQAGAIELIGVPIVAGEICLGALGLFKLDSSKHFTQRDADLAESVGRQAGVAIQNAHLFAEAQRRTEELSQALARLEELDHLKNEFIQNASHELRTPISIIRGYAEVLDSGELGELAGDIREPVAIIARRSRMLSDLVEDLALILDAEAGRSKQGLINLAQLVQRLLVDFQIAAEQSGLTLSADIAPNVPLVPGNPIHLERVLDNLLSNAFKFTPVGGRVSVRLHSKEDKIILEVSDTGVGIPTAQLSRVFERFYQVDGSTTRRHSGAGLGLALVKEIVDAHNGQVTAQSTEGQGSTFIVRLPGAPKS